MVPGVFWRSQPWFVVCVCYLECFGDPGLGLWCVCVCVCATWSVLEILALVCSVCVGVCYLECFGDPGLGLGVDGRASHSARGALLQVAEAEAQVLLVRVLLDLGTTRVRELDQIS